MDVSKNSALDVAHLVQHFVHQEYDNRIGPILRYADL